jgi:hypothetical protein
VGDLLVLWDVDYTLLSAGGLGNRLYGEVFKDMVLPDLTDAVRVLAAVTGQA